MTRTAAARVTGCHWCEWEIVTAPDGSQPGSESLVPLLHVMLVHQSEAEARMVEPVGSVLATIRATDLVTEAGWRKAAEGGTTNCECGHSFADHCVIDEHSDCPCGCSYKVAS